MTKQVFDYAIQYIITNGRDLGKKILLALLVFFVIYIFIKRIINRVKTRIRENNVHPNSEYHIKLSNLIWKILFVIGMIFNILIVFEVVWIDVALLMAGISLWIWFAMETLISNMVAWFFILTNKKFKIWDFIQILWSFNTNWTVEEINIKHTIIRTVDKRRLLIPNITMVSTPIKTIKSEDLIRWDLEVELPRHINIEQIKTILNQSINEQEDIIHKNYTTTYIKEFSAKWYKFNSVFFVDPKEWTPFVVSSNLRNKITQTLKKYWINFPYEHIVVNIE